MFFVGIGLCLLCWMQFSASLLELEAEGLKNKGYEERRESFVFTAYFISGCLEITLGQISCTKIHAHWTWTLRILILGLASFPDFANREQERQAQLCMSILCFLHCRLFSCFDVAKVRFFSYSAIFCVLYFYMMGVGSCRFCSAIQNKNSEFCSVVQNTFRIFAFWNYSENDRQGTYKKHNIRRVWIYTTSWHCAEKRGTWTSRELCIRRS